MPCLLQMPLELQASQSLDALTSSLENISVSTPKLRAKRPNAPVSIALTESLLADPVPEIAAKNGLTMENIAKDSKYKFERVHVEFLKKLGQGAGGSVHKVLHTPTGLTMACKVLAVNTGDQNKHI